ncbi:MAG TPA: DNA mismatch repair protein MutS [Candidatus Anaerostipes excrementavium]|mgnify:FL=1|uniref:DNA mismatch repair protein MutS n=1 Tax=Candidatus Anaerostipes excrementavium TaxID=2838463 RepID=A0A9D1WWF3_9FIRM|nr:DNA mismatch repair protein MutS [uncultured Anaerostipes sp.]HIX68403.1 DNA mismatch repair protein MutS [Candidatus Anaerostipes excrementavium]
MGKLTPMMQQYMKIKEENKDCILFYRLGDFYEMFFDDALIASKELEITLTGKNCGLEERAPMCGVPYHAADSYLNKLVEKGYKVGICEQVEDPSQAKGIVKREIVRIVTPGTNISQQSLDDEKNNYLMCIFCNDGSYGISLVDVTTGDFRMTSMDSLSKVQDEIFKFSPAEIICNDAFFICGIDLDYLKDKMSIMVSGIDHYYFDEEQAADRIKQQFKVGGLEGLGITDYPMGVIATGALLGYLHETQKSSLDHLMHITAYETSEFMVIDSSSRRNLELCETLRDKQKKGSLLWVLDKTKTAMGARMLRSMIEQPLVDKKKIEERYDALDSLTKQAMVREELREYLNPIYDLERLMTKVSYKTANPRDMIAFKTSLKWLPPIRMILEECKDPLLTALREALDPMEDIYQLLEDSIVEEPPLAVKEGGIIKDGFKEEIDRLKRAKTEGKQWLMELEERERKTTGIKNLKVKFNKVFGYYLDVTNSYKDLVPDHYIRKQTLANSERYTTEELNQLADTILGSEDRLYAMEYETFVEIRETLAGEMERIAKTAHVIAQIDALASLAYVAERNHYVRPKLNLRGTIDIKEGRHPVVEQMIQNDMFISNDTYLDQKKNRVSIITGPNMAGKSTYMRQAALIVLMAQVGSFVPAKKANIGIVDRIFTRVGASDDLASGQSTFMVEMSEVANILRNATKNSLLILDEIGRGTSTYDGLSIAWAVVEYISNPKLLGAKTLFATHYHELTELEGKIDSVNNYCIAVKEQGDDIVFLRKIIKGGADKSYGVQVAKLAGVPEPVIARAKEISRELSDHDIASKAREIMPYGEAQQLSFFQQSDEPTMEHPFMAEIREKDLSDVTPLEALNYLYTLQEKLRKEE